MPRWPINFDWKINFDGDILRCLAKAEGHRITTTRIPIPPSYAKEINKINIVRQIKGTTGLEGNPLTEQEVEKIIENVEIKNPNFSQDERETVESIHGKEVENAYAVQAFIKKNAITSQPLIITEELIKKLHFLTTKDIPSESNIPGQYRSIGVTAGEYTAPVPEEIPKLMEVFTKRINEGNFNEDFGPLFKAIVAHFYLISIHPFGDGNGRTSRALEAYILYQSKFNARGFYSLANYFYRNREKYIEELQNARFKYDADLTSFCKFALMGFVEEIEAIQDLMFNYIKKITFSLYVEELYAKGKINGRCVAIVNFLNRFNEEVSLQQLRDKKHPILSELYSDVKTTKTIQRDIQQMKQFDLIKINGDGLIKANVSIMEQFEA